MGAGVGGAAAARGGTGVRAPSRAPLRSAGSLFPLPRLPPRSACLESRDYLPSVCARFASSIAHGPRGGHFRMAFTLFVLDFAVLCVFPLYHLYYTFLHSK